MSAGRSIYGICRRVSRRGVSGSLRFAQAIDQVQDGQERMGEEHAWPGVTHDLLDPCSPGRRIAVHGASAAGGFMFLKRAGPQSFVRVVEQIDAVRAQRLSVLVVVGTVSPDHVLHGLGFAPHPPGQQRLLHNCFWAM